MRAPFGERAWLDKYELIMTDGSMTAWWCTCQATLLRAYFKTQLEVRDPCCGLCVFA
ncbi:MAG: hypothetical protein M3371_01125 [Acidobacteriota bacterium]|nr:hypothetical protein [Acidobacteriota bacterium]